MILHCLWKIWHDGFVLGDISRPLGLRFSKNGKWRWIYPRRRRNFRLVYKVVRNFGSGNSVLESYQEYTWWPHVTSKLAGRSFFSACGKVDVRPPVAWHALALNKLFCPEALIITVNALHLKAQKIYLTLTLGNTECIIFCLFTNKKYVQNAFLKIIYNFQLDARLVSIKAISNISWIILFCVSTSSPNPDFLFYYIFKCLYLIRWLYVV